MLHSHHIELIVIPNSHIGKNAHVSLTLLILSLTVEFQLTYVTHGKKNYRGNKLESKHPQNHHHWQLHPNQIQ